MLKSQKNQRGLQKKPLAVRIVEEEEKIDAQNAHNKHHSQASNIIFVFGQWVI